MNPPFQGSLKGTTSSFGSAAAISGDGLTVAIGAPNDNSGIGAVFIFVLNLNQWTQQAKIVASDYIGSTPVQGTAVSLSYDGNTLIFGGNSDGSNQGAVWFYRRTVNSWAEQNKIVGSGAIGNAFQGACVGIDNNATVACWGGYGDNSEVGAIWIATQTNNTWTQFGNKLVGTEYIGTPYQGYSVDISADGSTIISGAPVDASNTGSVWIFQWNGSAYVQYNAKIGGLNFGDYFGSAVGIAAYKGLITIFNGAVQTAKTGYVISASQFSQGFLNDQILTPVNPIGNSFFGNTIAVNATSNILVVGAPSDNNEQGCFYIFTIQ